MLGRPSTDGQGPLAALELDHVSKRFFIGHRAGLVHTLFRGRTRDELWALRDVSLRLEQVEVAQQLPVAMFGDAVA